MAKFFFPIVQVLHETQLVETFNLRAAIEYQLKNCTLYTTTSKVLLS